ncbi:MAG: vitamin K epoxide reductase family protein [Desulfobacterales bacterium]|jgi:uncharacterized membrane protein/protein-disulfide isomerase
MKKSPKDIKPFAYPVYFVTVVALIISGLLISGYLFRSHYLNYTDITYQSFCAISTSINCDTVSQSLYSILFGVPVAVWGIIGYTFLLGLVIPGWRRSALEARNWAIILWMALAFSIVSIWFAAISTFLIHSYCIMCIGIYLVSFFTLWFSWLIHRRFATRGLLADTVGDLNFLWQRRRLLTPLVSVALLGMIALMVFMPPYWHMTSARLSQSVPSGLTAEGHPWIGAVHPKIEIEMYSDYQCFQCRKIHFYLRQIIARHPDTIRIVHRHFPMDHTVNPIVKKPFYIGSGKMALLAMFAASKGKFFEMNDLLFDLAAKQKQINLKWLAQKTGLKPDDLFRSLNDPRLRQKLAGDIRKGIELRLVGTPGFVIDNEVYIGKLPAKVLEKYFN